MVSVAFSRITHRSLSALKPWDQNYRVGNVDAIIASIVRFGFNGALRVWQNGQVMAGNHALLALQTMNASGAVPPTGIEVKAGEWHVPCIDVSSLSRTEAVAFALADNRIQELGQNDPERLLEHLHTLCAEPDIFAAIGYNQSDLDLIEEEVAKLAGRGDSDNLEDGPSPSEKERQELAAKWGVSVGDVWQIGPHRVACGDSTNPEHVKALLGEQRAAFIVTDPPYGVEYDPMWRSASGLGSRRSGKVANDERSEWSEVFELWGADVLYHWCASCFFADVQAGLKARQFEPRAMIVWSKSQPVVSRGPYHWSHEPCIYAVRKGRRANFVEGRKDVTVWEASREPAAPGGHGTQKPVALFRRAIENHRFRVVADPFAGSGTVVVAANLASRSAIAMELDPGYCGAILERCQRLGIGEPARV